MLYRYRLAIISSLPNTGCENIDLVSKALIDYGIVTPEPIPGGLTLDTYVYDLHAHKFI